MRAGRLTSGEFLTEKAIQDKKAKMIIIAKDASANTKDKFTWLCKSKNIPFVEFGNKEQLGHSIGKAYRATIAILDEGFKNQLMQLVENE